MNDLKAKLEALAASANAAALAVTDFSEQVKAHMKPFEYAPCYANHFNDGKTATPICAYATRATQAEIDNGTAAKRWAGLLTWLHKREPIKAVLCGRLANLIEVSDGNYIITTYCAREGRAYAEMLEF